jgi:ethanolamine utilization protein EutM
MGGALGLLEVRGFAAAVTAADAAAKAADVTIEGYEQTKGSGLVMVKLRGEVGAVQAAVEAGAAAARQISTTVFAHVIPRPHEELVGKIISR